MKSIVTTSRVSLSLLLLACTGASLRDSQVFAQRLPETEAKAYAAAQNAPSADMRAKLFREFVRTYPESQLRADAARQEVENLYKSDAPSVQIVAAIDDLLSAKPDIGRTHPGYLARYVDILYNRGECLDDGLRILEAGMAPLRGNLKEPYERQALITLLLVAADIRKDKGQPREALASLTEAFEIARGLEHDVTVGFSDSKLKVSDVLDALGYYWLDNGDDAQALSYFACAARVDGDSSGPSYAHLRRLYVKSHGSDTGLQEFVMKRSISDCLLPDSRPAAN